jgi:transposase-like protein
VSIETSPTEDELSISANSDDETFERVLNGICDRMIRFWILARKNAVAADAIASRANEKLGKQGYPDKAAIDKFLAQDPTYTTAISNCSLYDRWVLRESAVARTLMLFRVNRLEGATYDHAGQVLTDEDIL